MKYIYTFCAFILLLLTQQIAAQDSKDTVIVNFGKESSIVFYINDKEDLNALEQHDLNAIAKDLKTKLQVIDTGQIDTTEEDQFLKELQVTVILEEMNRILLGRP